MKFSWQNLPKPFWCLAPMEGATDAAFRQIIKHGEQYPSVMFTEFVNVEGLMSKGKSRLEPYLTYEPAEQPLIVQLWGLEPDHFYSAAHEMVERGFAGVDINLGCPDKAVIKRGAGGALINNKPLVKEIVSAVKSGVNGYIPVSVKMRIGFKEIVTEEWATFILALGIDALSVHGRTVKELSLVPAHWDEIAKVVKIRDRMKLNTVIIGNGDVMSLFEADEKAKEFGVDGVMIGRGVFQNPWLFDKNKLIDHIEKQERIQLLLKHLELYQRLFGDQKPFEPLKRYFKIYIQNFSGAVELRMKLMECHSVDEVKMVLG